MLNAAGQSVRCNKSYSSPTVKWADCSDACLNMPYSLVFYQRWISIHSRNMFVAFPLLSLHFGVLCSQYISENPVCIGNRLEEGETPRKTHPHHSEENLFYSPFLGVSRQVSFAGFVTSLMRLLSPNPRYLPFSGGVCISILLLICLSCGFLTP